MTQQTALPFCFWNPLLTRRHGIMREPCGLKALAITYYLIVVPHGSMNKLMVSLTFNANDTPLQCIHCQWPWIAHLFFLNQQNLFSVKEEREVRNSQCGCQMLNSGDGQILKWLTGCSEGFHLEYSQVEAILWSKYGFCRQWSSSMEISLSLCGSLSSLHFLLGHLMPLESGYEN